MANVITAATIAALESLPVAANAVAYLSEPGRAGEFVWRAGDYSAPVAADGLKGLYVASSLAPASSGAWVRERDGDYGYPEWFGAKKDDPSGTIPQANLAALHSCHSLCQDTLLDAGVYYTSDVLKWTKSGKRLIGRGLGYGNGDGSTICLTGANASSQTIFQFGADSHGQLAYGLFCTDVKLSRIGDANPAPTGDVENAVKAVLYTHTANSEMRRVRAMKSPVGFHVTQTTTCILADCNYEPATSTAADISIGFLFGGYSVFGGNFVGANGSLRAEGNTAFAFPSATYSAHTLVYGLPADTWIDKHEGAGAKNGIEIVGLDAASMKDYIAGGSGQRVALQNNWSCNDITVSNCRIDGFSGIAFYAHYLNGSANLNVHNPYAASSGTAFSLNQIAGRVDVDGGEAEAWVAGQSGIDANNVRKLRIAGIQLRDFDIPLRINNCLCAEVRPHIFQPSFFASAAVELFNVKRSLVQPFVNGGATRIGVGVKLDSHCGYNEVNGSGIDPGCFQVITGANKVQFEYSPGTFGDVNAGAGQAAFQAAVNMLSGVIG